MVDAARNAPNHATSSNETMTPPGMPSTQNNTMKLRARQPTSPTSSEASAEDVPLFMSSETDRKSRRSLSPISNRASRKKSRHSEPITKKLEDNAAGENMAWDTINREISEWQNVCRTGRPCWWSSVSRWTQGGACSTWQEKLHPIPPWHMSPEHIKRPVQRYDEQRRAATDSYVPDNNNVPDLAHIIAVQLLSACFTLPPEQLSNYAVSAYHCFDVNGPTEIPDLRLISSLRMHTDARYSPSFGHQARNTSPEYRWQGAYDGPSPYRSHGSSSDREALNMEASTKDSRKRRIHRAPHVTEDSTADYSMGSHPQSQDLDSILPETAAKARRQFKDGTGADQKAESSTSDKDIKSCPSTPSEFDAHLTGHTPNTLQTHRYSRTPDQARRQTLQPVIRSEPHHIYIQPVKELVVKRWRTLRHRFGYGPGYVHHEPATRGANATSTSLRSAPAEGSVESPALSSDGSESRRQTRASGDMHGNGMESDPRFNTPTSATGSEVPSPEHLEHPSPGITHTRVLGVAEVIANAFANSGLTTAVSQCFTPPNSLNSSNAPSPSAATPTTELLRSKTDSGYFNRTLTPNSKPLNSPPTSSARRHGRRRHQRSNLSEIHTPDDIGDRSDVSLPGTQLASPREESGSEAVGGLLEKFPKLDNNEKKPLLSNIPPHATSSRSSKDETLDLETATGKMRRPSIVRTSTSGTQVFTPSRDGVELNGFPTGLPSQTWDEHGAGAKRKERSFL